MAKCILHFDQIEIISKKSDAAHSDNDWLIVHWFVGTDLKESHTIPLKNTSGSTILESGQTLQPLSLEVACVDADLVTAVFQIVNLGSTDIAAQVQAIGKIAQKGAETFAEVYLTIAAKVLPLTPTPAGEIIGQAIELFKPLLVDGVGAAFEEIIIPFFSDVAEFVSGVLGKPNCNGDVLHDVAIFDPGQPASFQIQTISKVYTGSTSSFCGNPRTMVTLTLERIPEVVPVFPPTPVLQWQMVPAKGESADNWLGTWTSGPAGPRAFVAVTISRSTVEAGAYALTVEEITDPRFNAEFEAADAVDWPETVLVRPFKGNVFGTIKPWVSGIMSPGDLTLAAYAATAKVQTMELAGSGMGAGSLSGSAGVMLSPLSTGVTIPGSSAPAVALDLAWHRPKNAIVTRPAGDPVRAGGAAFPGVYGFDEVDAFVMEGKGVTLCFYNFMQGQSLIARCLRYMRAESSSFTAADVSLGKFTVL